MALAGAGLVSRAVGRLAAWPTSSRDRRAQALGDGPVIATAVLLAL